MELTETSKTNNEKLLTDEIIKSDILVDASTRHDTSIHIVSNDLIGKTLPHTVLLDITADPYDFGKNPAYFIGGTIIGGGTNTGNTVKIWKLHENFWT